MPPFQDLESVINTIADPIFVKDRQHCWVLLNDALCRFMGFDREQLIGKSDYDFFPRAEADVFWTKDEEVFETGAENVNDEEFTDAAGRKHFITTKKTLYVSPAGEKFIVGIIRDLTALKRAQQDLQSARDRLESTVSERTAELAAANEALRQQIAENERTADQLRHSQKMEAIGRLAGGVAHDFNNLLNIILGYAVVIQEHALADAKLRESAAQIAGAAEKAAILTRELLAFSRKQVLQPELVNVDDVLRSLAKMLPALIGEDVDLRVQPESARPYVRAGRGQLEQIIVNLAANARDAMREGGSLAISTWDLDLKDDEDYDEEEHIPPGEYVVLMISDTGTGMDAVTQEHIFEPFFTTKESGKGTGLGLSTVYGIVTQNGGHIRVSSELGQGTTIKIYLPRSSEVAPVATATEPSDTSWRGTETLLLVEDQPHLRDLLGEVLKAKGYTVVSAESGRAAIAAAIRHPRIDLLITDVIMPGMRGWEVGRRVTALHPESKVLYISGHTDTDLAREGALGDGQFLLEKPFKPEVLLNKVREILGKEVPRGEQKAG